MWSMRRGRMSLTLCVSMSFRNALKYHVSQSQKEDEAEAEKRKAKEEEEDVDIYTLEENPTLDLHAGGGVNGNGAHHPQKPRPGPKLNGVNGHGHELGPNGVNGHINANGDADENEDTRWADEEADEDTEAFKMVVKILDDEQQ